MSKRKNHKKRIKKAAEAAKKHPKLIIALSVIAALLIVTFILLWYFKPGMFGYFFKPRGGEIPDGTKAEIVSADLSVHFLELGNKYTGDCTLIKCGDTEILIDAGSRQTSAATIKGYIDEFCEDGKLEYVIATHAHEDHIAGFVGNESGSAKSGILYQYKIGTLIQFARHDVNTGIYRAYCEAVDYVDENGTEVYTALQCWNNSDGASRQYKISDAVTLNVLYNYYYENKAGEENDYSVCIMLTQTTADGEKNFLFTGDLEEKGESYLVDYNSLPQVELFKGGHHGSYNATTEKLLKRIKPKAVAVCCCCGTQEYRASKENVFPSQAFIDRVSRYTDKIYCTTLIVDYQNNVFKSMNGNIVFYVSGKEIKLWCSDNNLKLKETEWFQSNRTWPSYGI